MPLYNRREPDLDIDTPLKLTGTRKSPIHTDYDVFGLHKKRTLIDGELRTVEYYAEYDGATYSDLVLKEERTYVRNMYNLVQYRTQVSTWYCEDDTVGIENTTTKYYTLSESITESETRRGNLVADARIYLLSQVGITNCYILMTALNEQTSLYVQGFTEPLITGINTSVELFMTPTIKATVTDILTIS